MAEEWKHINDKYEISSFGNIRNINSHKIVYTEISNNGYFRFRLNHKWHKVHRLVAFAFLENPKNGQIIDHIDFNRLNNNVNNLRWCDAKENSINRKSINKLGRCVYKIGNKYKSRCRCNYQNITIGSYDSALEARIRRQIYILTNNLSIDYINKEDVQNLNVH